MKRVFIVLMVLLTIGGLTASTVLALQLVVEERIESMSGAPVEEDFFFSGKVANKVHGH